MSHHFDTPTALADPRINVCDFYLFSGGPVTTVMAMTVNPDAGISAPDTFREEAIYAFRFDLNNDDQEEVTFKVRFGPVEHRHGGEYEHFQTFEVRRATGVEAVKGEDGELIASGQTGAVVKTDVDTMVFAGLAPDLFAGDAVALGAFRSSFFNDGKHRPEVFLERRNFFARRNATAIVIEVPARFIGQGLVRGWATVSLYGHAPEIQLSRWGLPLITNLFMPDPEMKERFNRAIPADNQEPFVAHVRDVTERLTSLAGSTSNPAEYARQLIARLFPTMLPYELNTQAAFELAGFNGRGLADDAMNIMLSLATNTGVGAGVAPDKSRIRESFPYFGQPFTREEQAGVAPARPGAKRAE